MIDLKFEQVVPDQSSSFRCYHNICDDLASDHPWHFHPEYELSWVIRSSGMRYVGNYIEPYTPGEVVLYGPNLPHCSRNDASAVDGGVVEYITLQFDPACLGHDFLDLAEAQAIRTLLQESHQGIMFSPDAAAVIGPHLRELIGMTGMGRLIKLAEILHIATTVERRILTSPDYIDTVIVDHRLVDRLNRVQRYIDEHFRGVVSQADIADQLEMSPSTFSKFIRAATGQTFMAMVRLARINEACRLLVYGDERITDVALECGYQHTSHFDRNFFEVKGVSPSDYRRRAKALSEQRAAAEPQAVAAHA